MPTALIATCLLTMFFSLSQRKIMITFKIHLNKYPILSKYQIEQDFVLFWEESQWGKYVWLICVGWIGYFSFSYLKNYFRLGKNILTQNNRKERNKQYSLCLFQNSKVKKVASTVFNLKGPQTSSTLSLVGIKPFFKCASLIFVIYRTTEFGKNHIQ